MHNSLKDLLIGIIRYAAQGNDIIVKTPSVLLSARKFDSFVSWIVIYKKLKFNIISETGDTDMVFHSIISFINDTDRGNNAAVNS